MKDKRKIHDPVSYCRYSETLRKGKKPRARTGGPLALGHLKVICTVLSVVPHTLCGASNLTGHVKCSVVRFTTPSFLVHAGHRTGFKNIRP